MSISTVFFYRSLKVLCCYGLVAPCQSCSILFFFLIFSTFIQDFFIAIAQLRYLYGEQKQNHDSNPGLLDSSPVQCTEH